jgi:hypothetical protein
VASPDNTNAPDFDGGWQLSFLAQFGTFSPPLPWKTPIGPWPAAEIRGVRLQGGDAVNSRMPSHTSDAPASNSTIFTNLGPRATGTYVNYGPLVTGDGVSSEPEIWEALPFTPRFDSHAKTLAAAIGHVMGAKLVNLGIYSDNAGTVGTLLPGGQGSTANIPETGDCCSLATVTLPDAGVALTAGVQYWLVASPDNANAPDFEGAWETSSLAFGAYQEPESFINWTSVTGGWLAAEIRGTVP